MRSGPSTALCGLLGPGMVIVTVLGILYARFGELAVLQRVLAAVAAAAAGMMIGTIGRMAEPLLRGGAGFAPFVALAAFAAIGVLRWPLWPVLAVLVPISIAIAWRGGR
jgi:chromate transporter